MNFFATRLAWILLLTCPIFAQDDDSFKKEIKPLLERYCWDCHGDGAKKGNLNMDEFTTVASIKAKAKTWQSVHFNIDNWIMPPEDEDEQPTPAERMKLARWIDSVINHYDPAKPDPGRVTIRRLNREEYNNTIRDLLGVDINPASEFPGDDTGHGFDTIGDVLALPPILMERYLSAADRVLDAAFNAAAVQSEKLDFHPVSLTGDGRRLGRDSGQETYSLTDNGAAGIRNHFPAAGIYRIRAKVYADQAGDEPAKAELVSENKSFGVFEVKATDHEKAQWIQAEVELERGSRRVSTRFINDFYDEKRPEGQRDRNLYILRMQIEGPLKIRDDDPIKGGMAKLILAPMEKGGENPQSARTILQTFANRAFRRPTQPAEIDRLMRIFELSRSKGENFKGSLVNAMKAVLVSPYFIYRTEWQPEPNNPAQIVELNELALASRLSYFLWSSMPDDELLGLAFRNELRKNLPAQVVRMIKDPKAKALVENFGGQWLETRTLEVVQPDQKRFRFPNFLRDAMKRETEELFAYIMRENRSVMEFVTADYTFLNESLARHYMIPNVTGDGFQKVTLPPQSLRRGVLTHGSILTITSDPVRTSPVKRGKWIMENILGIPSPPPPPNVPTLEEGAEGKQVKGTVRQQLELHRTKPGCASCHSLIDPLGFGLENFDPIGAFRSFDNGIKVDSTGEFTTGQKFSNAVELAAVINAEKQDYFLRCLATKMMTYALGRGLEPYDRPAIDGILSRMKREKLGFHSLVLGIVDSLPFQKRRGDAFKPSPKTAGQ